MKSFAIGDLVTVNAARYTSPYTTVYVGRKVVGVAKSMQQPQFVEDARPSLKERLMGKL